MKILAIGDVESKYLWDYFERSKLEGIDLIISCGDLAPEYLSFLATFTSAPVLYVHGNHDDKYEKRPPEGCICIEDNIYKFDLNEDFKKYLLKLVNETIDVIENYKYEKRDYSNDKVIYMRNLNNLKTGLFEGLQTKYKMQQYNIKEQNKLRKGTKSCLEKHYNGDDMLTDIFDYVNKLG